MENNIYFQLEPNAIEPIRGSRYSAGLDLASSEDYVIAVRKRKLIETGVKFIIPQGVYGRLAGRSGLALNNSIDVTAGVIDIDFEGTVKVILINNGDKPFHIKKGDRIAQIIFEKIVEPQYVNSFQKTAEETCLNFISLKRETDGFGSTDTKNN